ncbi:MAG: lipid II flippase MurJ, partial [Solirubrobacteraceae bacterium]
MEIVSMTATEADPLLARHSLSVAQWTLFSRVTGFVRAAVIAAILGATYFGNTFQATNTIPNLVFEFLTGSLLTTLLVPALVRHVDTHDARATKRVADNFLGLALAGFGAITILGIASGPLLVKLLSLAAGSATVAPCPQHAGLILLALLLPPVPLSALAGIGGAVMNAHGGFGLAAAAPALEAVGVVAT